MPHREPPPAEPSLFSWHTHSFVPQTHAERCQFSNAVVDGMQSRRTALTADGEAAGWALCFARKKRSQEAWAAQRPRYENQVPIAEGFSHPACRSDSGHELPGISWSLQPSKRPTSRSASPRTNRLSRAPAGSRKCGQEREPFAPAPAGSTSGTFSRVKRYWLWKKQPSLALRPLLAPYSRTHLAPPPGAASGSSWSLFGLAS